MSKNRGSCQGNLNSRNESCVPKFTTFLNQVLYSLLKLENNPQQKCGATIKDITKYMRGNFQVCGDVSSQVETSLNEAIKFGYVYENDSKFFTVGAIAKIQLCNNPERKKELALEAMQIFTHKPNLYQKSRPSRVCAKKPNPCNEETNANKDIFNQSTDAIEEMISQLASIIEERKSKEKEKEEMKTCIRQETCATLKKCDKIECPADKKKCEAIQKCKAKQKCETKMETRAKKKCKQAKALASSSKKCKSNLEIAKLGYTSKKCDVETFASDFGLAKMPQRDNCSSKPVVYVPTSTTASSCESPKKSILRKRRFVKKRLPCENKRKQEDSENCSKSDSCSENTDGESSYEESGSSCNGSCCKPRPKPEPKVTFSKDCRPTKRKRRTRKRKKCDCT